MGRRLVLAIVSVVVFAGIIVGALSWSWAQNTPYNPGDPFYAWQQAAVRLWRGSMGSSRANLGLPVTIEPAAVAAAPTPTTASGGEPTRLPTPSAADILDAAHVVPFPPAAAEQIDHSFFPLAGGHDVADCAACHTQGDYKGTPSACVNCHAPDDPHEGAYGADCAGCHVIDDWQPVSFDHALMGSQDCRVCHTPPANHYTGACRNCHTDTTDFAVFIFSHDNIGLTDCRGCHAPPSGHYAGTCRSCHVSTNDFNVIQFDHTNVTGVDCGAATLRRPTITPARAAVATKMPATSAR